MKKNTKKLKLNVETMKILTAPDLVEIVGGWRNDPQRCTVQLSGCATGTG